LRISKGIRNFTWNLEGKSYSFSRPHHESIQGSTGIASLILSLGTNWRWGVKLTFQLFYSLGKDHYACGKGGWVGCRVSLDILENRRLSFPCWKLFPRIIQPIASVIGMRHIMTFWSMMDRMYDSGPIINRIYKWSHQIMI